jgi:hypothetical protein
MEREWGGKGGGYVCENDIEGGNLRLFSGGRSGEGTLSVAMKRSVEGDDGRA